MNRSDALSFTFVTPPRVVVGWGAATDDRLADEAARLGRRPLVVSGRSLRASGALDTILANLHAKGLDPVTHENAPSEPDLAALQACIDAAKRCDSVIAIGGGSVLDVAKGAAALAPSGVSARDCFAGRAAVPDTGKPILAAPTTAGTGSEATWVGVFVDKETRRKASIRGGAMMPTVVVLDAQLSASCPLAVTAHAGMDAFVQAVEAFTSTGANPLTDALARPAAQMVGNNLPRALREPGDKSAREALLLASFMAGIALNTARLGLVHGLAHPIGALTGAPHGLICGLLMPAVMRFNQDAVEAKYARLARDRAVEGVNAFISNVEQMRHDAGIPARLLEIGLNESDLDAIAREAMTSGSTKANPRLVTEADARAVAFACL